MIARGQFTDFNSSQSASAQVHFTYYEVSKLALSIMTPTNDLTYPAKILTFSWWFLVVFVITPVEIWWFYQFWRRRRNLFISKRLPRLLLAATVGCWIFTLFQSSMWTVEYIWDPTFPNVEGPIWSNYGLLSGFASYCVIVEYTGVSLSRWWLLYYSYVDISMTHSVSFSEKFRCLMAQNH